MIPGIDAATAESGPAARADPGATGDSVLECPWMTGESVRFTLIDPGDEAAAHRSVAPDRGIVVLRTDPGPPPERRDHPPPSRSSRRGSWACSRRSSGWSRSAASSGSSTRMDGRTVMSACSPGRGSSSRSRFAIVLACILRLAIELRRIDREGRRAREELRAANESLGARIAERTRVEHELRAASSAIASWPTRCPRSSGRPGPTAGSTTTTAAGTTTPA